jgi:hypothetical protein
MFLNIEVALARSPTFSDDEAFTLLMLRHILVAAIHELVKIGKAAESE